jgi:hypothetical protein
MPELRAFHDTAQHPKLQVDCLVRDASTARASIGRGIERGVRNLSLVNIEKVGKGLRTSLPKLFEKV